MSYSVEWIPAIYDRTAGDVLNAQSDISLVNPKGCYNVVDLNRIENNTKWVAEDIVARKIYRTPLSLAIKTNWTSSEIPTREDMNRIIGNVRILMGVSNPEIQNDFSNIYESSQFSYSLANAIEHNLQIMHDQPNLPIKYWYIEIENGIIEETGTSADWFAEDEIIHIRGVEYGEYAQYQEFDHWTGDTNDLQYVGDVNEQSTTFQVQYHNTKLTANFNTRLPRTLTLNSGYISIGGVQPSGPSTGTYFAGDKILIIANRAPSGKGFYKWEGTEDALENLTGASEQDPSTCWLTMPDCDVTLTPKYIWANQHYVEVNNGGGDGWYDYNDYVSIYPDNRGSKWEFSYWSGDTGYLENVTAHSFRMPDVNRNLSFTANYTYIYSYNTVDVVDGNINGSAKGENLREGSTQNISATIPEGYGFDYWSLEGVGSIANPQAANTTLTIGDGNAVATAHFKPLHSVTVINVNNNGGTSTWNATEGKTTVINTNEFTSDKTFEYWEDESGNKYTSTRREFSMPAQDKIFTAHYRNRNTWRLTVNDNGNTYIYDMLEGSSRGITPRHTPSGYKFKSWSYSGSVRSFNYTWSANATIQIGNGNASATVNYEPVEPPKVYHTLSVTNGSGSGSYYEGQYFACYGNQAPSTYEFSHWTNANGDIISYSNPYTGYMGSSDISITANYKPIPYFTVTVIDGSGSGTYIRNSYPTIQMNPAPEGKKFLQWEVIEGDANDVELPKAETTRIRNLTHNVTVQATYYVPDPEIKYTLTIQDKDEQIKSQYNYSVGTQVNIYADSPDEGYYFFKWEGDTQYLVDVYNANTIVNMPARDIVLTMHYEREGYIPTYFVLIQGGECLVETSVDEETGEVTERWDTRGEFTEKSIVKIRANPPEDSDWEFKCWSAAPDDDKSITTVNDIYSSDTYVTVAGFDITLIRDVTRKEFYELKINNGEVSGEYHKDDDVVVYWVDPSTDLQHHTFTRWSGNDLAYLKNFDIWTPGTPDEPQVIKMPARKKVEITGNSNVTYRVKVNNGSIKETGEREQYYPEGTILTISSNTPEEGKRFYHWEGNTDYLDNMYNPNAKLTTPKGAVEFTAVYVNENDRNSIGYVLTSIYDNTTINIDDIIVIAGEIEVGFIITDISGHIYLITSVSNTTATIMRMTQKDTGPEEEEEIEDGE